MGTNDWFILVFAFDGKCEQALAESFLKDAGLQTECIDRHEQHYLIVESNADTDAADLTDLVSSIDPEARLLSTHNWLARKSIA